MEEAPAARPRQHSWLNTPNNIAVLDEARRLRNILTNVPLDERQEVAAVFPDFLELYAQVVQQNFPSFALVGPPGVGKSTALEAFLQTFSGLDDLRLPQGLGHTTPFLATFVVNSTLPNIPCVRIIPYETTEDIRELFQQYRNHRNAKPRVLEVEVERTFTGYILQFLERRNLRGDVKPRDFPDHPMWDEFVQESVENRKPLEIHFDFELVPNQGDWVFQTIEQLMLMHFVDRRVGPVPIPFPRSLEIHLPGNYWNLPRDFRFLDTRGLNKKDPNVPPEILVDQNLVNIFCARYNPGDVPNEIQDFIDDRFQELETLPFRSAWLLLSHNNEWANRVRNVEGELLEGPEARADRMQNFRDQFSELPQGHILDSQVDVLDALNPESVQAGIWWLVNVGYNLEYWNLHHLEQELTLYRDLAHRKWYNEHFIPGYNRFVDEIRTLIIHPNEFERIIVNHYHLVYSSTIAAVMNRRGGPWRNIYFRDDILGLFRQQLLFSLQGLRAFVVINNHTQPWLDNLIGALARHIEIQVMFLHCYEVLRVDQELWNRAQGRYGQGQGYRKDVLTMIARWLQNHINLVHEDFTLFKTLCFPPIHNQ